MPRPPKHKQNPEAVDLLRSLKLKLECATDAELADHLDVPSSSLTRWRREGLPAPIKALMQLFLGKSDSTTVELIERLKRMMNCESDAALSQTLGVKEHQIQIWKRKAFPEHMVTILDAILPQLDETVATSLSYEEKFQNRPCVYFVQSHEGGPIKIGYTTHLKKRLAKMRTDSPQPLNVLFAVDASMLEERGFHSIFTETRAHGEWFEPTSELLDFIAEQKYEYEAWSG